MMKFGLLGHNISYSLSPHIHKKIAAKPISYEIFDISPQNLELQLSTVLGGLNGFNITIPYKTSILKYCHETDDMVKKLGAANTVRIRDNKWKAYNTDYLAFIKVLTHYVEDYLHYHPVIVGYGGAARAVLFALENLGFMHLSVLGGYSENERMHFIEEMSSGLRLRILDNLPDLPLLWINCTPVGSKRFPEIPELFYSMKSKDYLFDLNYTPRPTCLQQFAEKRKLRSINGLRMLVFQALEAQKIWMSTSGMDISDIEKIIYEIHQ